MGGPSAQATANSKAQTDFYNQMTSEQNQVFGDQQDLLNSIKAVSLPILQNGPNQYGFTPAEDSLLRGEISSQGAQATTNAVNAQELREKQLAGGASVLPSGANAELETQAQVTGAQSTAQNLMQERLAGYQQGNQNYSQALAALSGNITALAPTSYASATANAGSGATNAINLADSERSNLLSSVLGGVFGGATSMFTGGLSSLFKGGKSSPNVTQQPLPDGTIDY